MRHISAAAFLFGVVLVAVPGSRGQVLLDDDFNDGDAVGWEEFDGAFAVVNGEYVITTNGYCNDGRSVAGSAAWTAYRVDLDFFVDSTESGAHAAILFRVQEIATGCDAGEYYQAFVFPDNVGFCRMNYSGGFCTVLASASHASPLQEWHHATLIVDGTYASLALDGEVVLTLDSFVEYPAGRIGVKSVNTQSVRYDNILVRGPMNWSWTDLGQGLAGAGGAAPTLSGSGELVSGSVTSLAVQGAASFAPTLLVVGLSELSVPFKGGMMVPHPDLLLATLTDGFGELLLGAPWPPGIPGGTAAWLQAWVTDAAGPKGYSASNAVRADVP
jgi:hypothetical protein